MTTKYAAWAKESPDEMRDEAAHALAQALGAANITEVVRIPPADLDKSSMQVGVYVTYEDSDHTVTPEEMRALIDSALA